MSDTLLDRVVAAIGHQYTIEGEIGRGGMSAVFCARDNRLNRRVAVKVLPPELSYDPAIRPRFTREAQTSAQLSHSHIVPIYDVGERDGIAYLVMAYVGGGNLGALLAREPRQPIEEVRRLTREIADALDYAHARGVIHRDIKPDNILLDAESGRAMVTDFGIARAIESGSRLTLTGIAVGTPTYMSPEQAVGEREVDGRSDIYSLGVLAYQMLTGRVPFAAGNSMALLLKHVSERPRPIAELRPDVPKALREAVERALMKAPEDRWPTAAALRDALASDDSQAAPWRAEQREPVRYTSPNPDRPRRDKLARGDRPGQVRNRTNELEVLPAVSAVQRPGDLVLVPEHLAALTAEQRADLKLWHGRVDLYERVKAVRGYVWLTLGAYVGSILGLVAVAEAEIVPLVLGPLVPLWMTRKLWRRGKSLKASGLKRRRVFLMPRAKWVIPKPPAPPKNKELAKLASREVLESPEGAAIRRAADDRAAILHIVSTLSKADRALLPDIAPTANALVERVAHVAGMLHRLDEGFDPASIEALDARIAEVDREPPSLEGERRITLLRRQRATLEELRDRRQMLERQLDNAGLALGNLRFDLVKFRSSGLQSALTDVSTATQEARALSREIGVVLEAAAEVREI